MLKQVMEIFDLLDDSRVDGNKVKTFFNEKGIDNIEIDEFTQGSTKVDFIKILIKGAAGKSVGGTAPTMGIIGRLGGIGARPERIGLVSDADGAVSALSAALKLGIMQQKGDVLDGDIYITTQICPNAPTQPHEPVPFMGSPVDMRLTNDKEVLPEMEAILSIDTTKGNRLLNSRGFAITPTVKEGYILKVSESLVSIMETVTGEYAKALPITTQDITPYGNGVYHINSLVQPCTVTDAPVVGVAITTQTAVPGCSTGASQEIDIARAAQFAIEAAKEFGKGKLSFYDKEEFELLVSKYGSMKHILTLGK